MMGKQKRTLKQARQTIGLFIPLTDSYNLGLWQGLETMAQDRDVNLIVFCGNHLNSPRESEVQSNIIYSIADHNRLDGLVILDTSLGAYISKEELKIFCHRYLPLPMICIGDGVDNIPNISIDNKKGLHELIAHLIEDHDRQHIAFIKGPEEHPEANPRFQAYQDILANYDLTYDPDLVAPGDFRLESGIEAVNTFLDQRQIAFDAIVAGNDDMAWGAIEALQKRGISVPEDVAVVGFDDSPKSLNFIPPLSTVKQPMVEMGRTAVDIILRQIDGQPVPLHTTLSTKPVLRESCGCFPHSLYQVKGEQNRIPLPKKSANHGSPLNLITWRYTFLPDLIQIFVQSPGGTSADLVKPQLEQVLDAFIVDLNKEDSESFIFALTKAIRKDIINGIDIYLWQNVLSVLRAKVLRLKNDYKIIHRAENLWQQARVLLGDMIRQAQAYHNMQVEKQAQLSRDFSQTLNTTFDIDELMNILERWLPLLGIPSCFLAVYENFKMETAIFEIPEKSLIRMACYQGKRLDLLLEDRLFPSNQLLPPELWPDDARFSWLIMPLNFKLNQIGFIILQAGPQESQVGKALRGEISSALQGSLLLEEISKHRDHLEDMVVKRSVELAEERTLLRTLIDNIIDLVYVKDNKCRFLMANPAAQKVMGVTSQEKLSGKTDFDFYPQKVATQFYADDSKIISTGKPLINKEEPLPNCKQGEKRWLLTTKIPLRDNQGKIIGLVGIGKDITERKQAVEALLRFNVELEQQVEERTRQLRQAQEEFINVAHSAGMAEIAGEVMHDLGNLLTSMVQAQTTIHDELKGSNLRFLSKIVDLLKENKDNLSSYITDDKKGKKIPLQLEKIKNILLEQIEKITSENNKLGEKLSSMNKILLEYTKYIGQQYIKEKIDIIDLILEIIAQNAPDALKPTIDVIQKNDIPPVSLQKFKFIKIIKILLNNAYEAMLEIDDREKRLSIEVSYEADDSIQIIFKDNGVGIDKKHLDKIFNHGFTTKEHNNGFGLHICANALIDMKGNIAVASDGEGCGASFTISLPVKLKDEQLVPDTTKSK